MLMGCNFNLFGIHIKSKLLDGIGLFLGLKFNSACNFVVIFNFNFFNYAFWIFGGNQSSKIEYPLIYQKDIRLDHSLYLARLCLVLYY